MSEGSRLSAGEAAQEARTFLGRFRTLVLATASPGGEPDASYAPFVRGAGNALYVYVSQLARHTANLAQTGNASVLFIASEEATDELFARHRLTFRCRASVIERESPEWRAVLDRFETQFGDVVGLIRPLEDFVLFELRPEHATYVRGFAQAYRLEGPELSMLG